MLAMATTPQNSDYGADSIKVLKGLDAVRKRPGMRDTDTLHRIDPEIVKKQVTAAGFVFDGESKLLANVGDDHSKPVFDKSIRGHTDQFIYKFRRP